MDEKLRVVIAVNTPDGGALRACRNLLQAAEEPVLAAGVMVQACHNTLQARGLTPRRSRKGSASSPPRCCTWPGGSVRAGHI